jgi:outer membrane protein assembly factor BamB
MKHMTVLNDADSVAGGAVYRIPARPLLVVSACLTLAMFLSCNRPPTLAAVPTGPETCFADVPYAFSATPTDPEHDSVAVRFDWGDSTVSDWSGWSASGQAVALTHAWQDTGTYEVRAWAKDRKHTSRVSDPLVVRVLVHRPPDTPSEPSGPDAGVQDSSCTFTSVATHPDNLPVAIRFSWGDGDTSDWSPVVASGESAQIGHAWSRAGTFQVSAQARDTGGAFSQWSSPHGIAVRPDTMRWRYETGRAITSSPALGRDGTIYIGSTDNYLYAVNPQGVLLWRYETGAQIRFSPAIAADGTVYFGSDDGSIYAVNPDGSLKWSHSIGYYVDRSPAIGADGTVYVGSSDLNLHAFSADGVQQWQYPIQWGIAGSPAIGADGTLYFGSYDSVHAVNPDGSPEWRCYVGGWPGPAAIAADGTIYVGSRDSGLYAVNPGGTVEWRYMIPDSTRFQPAIGADGTIYIGSAAGVLYAVHPDGTAWWSYTTGGAVSSTPAVASDGTLYFGSDDSYVYALNPDGSLKWRYLTGNAVGSSPAIADDGVMYVGSSDYNLYALWSPFPLADSPWPKLHHDLRNTGRVGGGR